MVRVTSIGSMALAQVRFEDREHSPELLDRLLVPSKVAMASLHLGQELLSLALETAPVECPGGSMTIERRNCSNSHGSTELTVV